MTTGALTRAHTNGNSTLPRVCVVGAGASGITTCKALLDRKIPFDCFDKGNRVGGIWVMDSDSGLASAYRELHINVSRERMEYRDYPMPKSLPYFPHHTQIVEYFEDYVRHFGIEPHIQLRTGVELAERRPDGLWEITLDTGEQRVYDALVVANGHHSVPRWPDPPIPGEFDGLQMHSHDYRDDSVLRDRDVVVVGMGNSAIDIAVESSYAARSTHQAIRRGTYVLPKFVLGRPMDMAWFWLQQYLLGRGFGRKPLGFQMPWPLRSWLYQFGHRFLIGRMEDYGLPKPEHRFLAQHPTISTRYLDRLVHGKITPKPPVVRLDGDHVIFADHSRVHTDVIVYATGYTVTVPFLAPGTVQVVDNHVDLYRHIFAPGVANLAFIGLVQPMAGSTMQVSELQARYLAAYLSGEYALPPEREMRAWIDKRRRRTQKRFVQSARHTIQIEQYELEWELRDELRRGRRRATGRPPAVTARATPDTETAGAGALA